MDEMTIHTFKKGDNTMLNTGITRLTAILLLVEVALINVCFLVLQNVFEFPAILNKPAAHVLPLFYKSSSIIIPTYYAFTLSSLLLIPLALLLHRVIATKPSIFMNITTTIGIVTAIFQTLGFIRWPFLIPYLATTYVNAHTSDVTRQSIEVFYNAFNIYAGHTVGEHLGFLFNALWGILLSIAILRSPLFAGPRWRWIGVMGIILSVGILGNPLQDLSLNFTPTAPYYFISNLTLVNLTYLISYALWAIWLIAPAIRLLVLRREQIAQTNTPQLQEAVQQLA
jgi:hypothetical protein